MPRDARLNRIIPALGARERAVAAVSAWKEGRREDPWLRRAVPEREQREFGELLALVRAINSRLTVLVLLYQEEVRRHWMTLGWIGAIKAWGLSTVALSHACVAGHTDLITESEAAERKAAARADTLRFREAAEYLAERVTDEDDSFPDDDDVAFEAEVRKQERRLRAAVGAGALNAAKGRVTAGVLWDWLGDETPLYPEWGMRVEVVPDERVEEVLRQRNLGERIRDSLAEAPVAFAEGFEVTSGSSPSNQMGEALHRSLVAGVASTWHGLRTVILCIDEARERLGDDPLHPDCRETLDTLIGDMEALVTMSDDPLGEIDLPEPTEADVEDLREVLALAMEE